MEIGGPASLKSMLRWFLNTPTVRGLWARCEVDKWKMILCSFTTRLKGICMETRVNAVDAENGDQFARARDLEQQLFVCVRLEMTHALRGEQGRHLPAGIARVLIEAPHVLQVDLIREINVLWALHGLGRRAGCSCSAHARTTAAAAAFGLRHVANHRAQSVAGARSTIHPIRRSVHTQSARESVSEVVAVAGSQVVAVLRPGGGHLPNHILQSTSNTSSMLRSDPLSETMLTVRSQDCCA